MKFAEHIYSEVLEDLPHHHTVFTIPKRLGAFFKYGRKLNTILSAPLHAHLCSRHKRDTRPYSVVIVPGGISLKLFS